MSDSDSSTEADPQAVELANAQAAQIAVTQQLVAQLGNQLDANGRLPIRHVPLTLQEQELLTDTIPLLAPDNLHGVVQIIRDAAKLTGEEDEIDLEIDQLDTQTQRKLLRYVTKFIKQPKGKKAKVIKKTKSPTAEEEGVMSVEEDNKARRWLQDAGFDPDDVNKECFLFHDGDYFTGVTPLIFFAREGNLTMCRNLFARGADCRKVTAGNRSMQALGRVSPMLAAASKGIFDVCDWLFRYGGAKDDLRRTPNSPGASPVHALLDYEWISDENRFAIIPWMIRHGAFARADNSGGIDDTTMRNDLYPKSRCWMFDKRLNILVWARMFVAAHDTFRLFLKGTILSSRSIRRHNNYYGTRSKYVKVSQSPVALLRGTSGILELIAAYAGTPKANDVRTVRQLIDLLSTFIDDTPFDEAEEEEDDEFDYENYFRNRDTENKRLLESYLECGILVIDPVNGLVTKGSKLNTID